MRKLGSHAIAKLVDFGLPLYAFGHLHVGVLLELLQLKPLPHQGMLQLNALKNGASMDAKSM